MRMKLLLAWAAAGALAACQGAEDAGNNAAGAGGDSSTGGNAQGQTGRSIGDAAAQSADLSQFSQAVQAAGLTDVLTSVGPYTVFAPVNAAFDAVPQETRTRLMAAEGRDQLTQLLTFHIVPGVVTAQDLGAAIQRGQGRATVTTVSGDNLTVTREGEALVVSDASGGRSRVVQADRIQSNGVIHHVDAVLMPGGGR
ncbi:MAG TPA: fasciclin domain-containing protein [Allosphingosinicella sp.]|nr:fasciclin domain-containing protein [Allosphingosinicella sp.]